MFYLLSLNIYTKTIFKNIFVYDQWRIAIVIVDSADLVYLEYLDIIW